MIVGEYREVAAMIEVGQLGTGTVMLPRPLA
jgi:hypothetical protein